MEPNERIEQLKEKIRKMGQYNIVSELQKLNSSFEDIRGSLLNLNLVKTNEELVALNKGIQEKLETIANSDGMRILNFGDLPGLAITNIKDAKTDITSLNELLTLANQKLDILAEEKDLNIAAQDRELFSQVISKLDDITNVRNVTISNIDKLKVNMPDSFVVSNIKEAKADSVKVDWENQPKVKFDLLSPLTWLKEKAIDPAVNAVLRYIAEPDRITITDERITEYYGDRKVVYSITKKNGKVTEVSRNES